MVTIAEILKNVIEGFPPLVIGSKSLTIRFFDGVLDDVKEQINTYKKVNSMPYPCIWLIRDFAQLEESNRVTITNLQLIALIDTENSYQTPERLENRINPYLVPIANDVIKGLKLSGVYVSNVNKTKLTFLGNPNAGVPSTNSSTNARTTTTKKLFADYMDGLKISINVSYDFNLNTVCYEFR